MESTSSRAIAIVGVGAILPDAPNVTTFWENIKTGRYSISEVEPDRWDPALYFNPDRRAPDKTYSKIGGWVRDFTWDPIKWRLPIPPRVVDAMDVSQKWAIACTRETLEDYGYPERSLDLDRTAVILGNAMGGERHYFTVLRAYFPEYARELMKSSSFAALPQAARDEIVRELHDRMSKHLPEITEDSMPGELANCIAGRIANIFNFHGPNYVCDAACASAMAAVSSAAEGLIQNHYDFAVTGGIDRNMGVSTFVKFCKIGALSGTGTRPYAEGADGFVMGEGAAIFLLRRLADAERDGDKIYAVLRGMGGSSDGRGKGITAPNPAGQKFAIERAWKNAGLSPETVTYIEGHGTSTRVGDVVEVNSMADALNGFQLPVHSVALGSVKSNFGHLKGAAGAAGLLKTVLALRDKVLPPSVHCDHPNPDIDFIHSPLYVNTQLKPWEMRPDGVRRAGLSAFGFGGTNFHAVLEEYIPHRLNGNGKSRVAVSEIPQKESETAMRTIDISSGPSVGSACKIPLRGALLIGASSEPALAERLRAIEKEARAGRAPSPSAPTAMDLRAAQRLAIDYVDATELANKSATAVKALASNQPAVWKALRAQGIFRGQGPSPKIAFLYPGQGSQYLNMLRPLRDIEPIVAETFAEADRIMTPLLGKPLSDFIFVNGGDVEAVAKADEDLRQTAVTQPAVLATDLALTRLLAAYGIEPDFTMGHSLGEYGALIAAGALPFADALEAVSARGREMTRFSPADKGRMAAVFAPLEQIERILKTVSGYVVIANINSEHQSVIGGESAAVEQAMAALLKAGYDVSQLPVSHAFHTSIVAAASEPLRSVLQRLHLQSPRLPIIANTNGEFYPTGPNVVPQMLDILAQQVAAPVQFIKGLRTLYAAGARMFVEVGPKKALQGFAEDVLGANGDVVAIFSNHPKVGDIAAFNQALCCLYAAGLGHGTTEAMNQASTVSESGLNSPLAETPQAAPAKISAQSSVSSTQPTNGDHFHELGRLFADVLERGWQIYKGGNAPSATVPVVITGAALGLPGTERIFDDTNIGRILRGQQFIDAIPMRFRQAMLDKHITRLVKSENGDPRFETINDVADVIKLAGRGRSFDLGKEFGVSGDRLAAFDRDTQLAIAAGLDALRDAGIPLVLRYKTTSKGTQLPDRWGLPDALRDETGVIFASAFPGLDSFADEMARYYADHAHHEQLAAFESLRSLVENNGHSSLKQEIDRRIAALLATLDKEPYVFDRRFLLRTLSMGHSQFAELIGARGPNTQINSACASTTQAVSLAQDWIRAGRCSRVIIISADDVTSDHLIDWMGAGFLASGAAATDEVVTEAATPFDRRRHGLIIGMGAAALVVESAEAAQQRSIRPICEVLATVTGNSAFHGTRLDVQHIGQIMERMIRAAETNFGISRHQIAPQTVFVSHETYTPARGGSASAEIHALRRVFGDVADQIVIANTKGLTGHAMGTGIEDVVAVKVLETGCVPPVANFKEVDPELGSLNLSKGGDYPVDYALHLGAGFGSQISMMLLRWVKTKDGIRRSPNELGYAYRIDDTATWNTWLTAIAGRAAAKLEVVHRTLRIEEQARPTQITEGVHATRAVAPILSAPLQPNLTSVEGSKPITVLISTAPATVPKTQVATPACSPPPVSPKTADAVKEKVLALVANITGYPVDMLDLDLDLEADLGVDTVKQAEVFATIRESYNIPRDENRKLRDYPTLAHVIRFVYEKRPDLAASFPSATASAPSEPTPVSCAPATDDSIKEKVLEIVAEKTGYPKDMLDLDLDLEADLGIDTVKQAEMFVAIRATYNIPREENMTLRDFPTLAHVIKFAQDRSRSSSNQIAQQSQAKKKAVASTTITAPAVVQTPRPEVASFDAANRIPRRVPIPLLRPPLSICKSTGVALEKGDRVVLMPDKAGVADALQQLLSAKGVTVLRIDGAPDADELISLLKAFLAAGPVRGIYWLPALDPEGDLRSMDPATWHEAIRFRLKLLYTCMRTLYEPISKPGTFLISATRLGGQHGYDDAGAVAPLGGAVTGFTKTYKRERPDATVKVVDFELGCRPTEIAQLLLQETLRDPGAIEIGCKDALRWTIGLEERSAADGKPALTMGQNTVFVITGAAGSIVSAITADLAAASGGIFYLLDVVPAPDPTNPDFTRFVSDKQALKSELFARIQARGERATPALVEKDLSALERAHAAQSAIDAVRAAGGTSQYFEVNLTDSKAVARVIEQIRQRSGRIDVLLHAAGLDRSHSLADKEPREFDLVFDVKCDGFFNLLHAIGDMPLGATVAFSSIAGRFGNPGQTDYSSANDLLCKIASSFRTTRPNTRAIAIDWTAWGGIGMATRGSIPKVMELAGIDMLPPEAGVPLIRRELTAGGTRGEVVIAQRLGLLLKEWDPTGGVESSPGAGDDKAFRHGPMVGRITSMGLYSGLTIETTLDPTAQPFLHDHQIDGTPVLPGVIGIEAFAEAALSVLPGWHIKAIEDVNFLAPFKFYRNEARVVTIEATLRTEAEELVADCRLIGRRALPHHAEPQVTTHFTARVRLTICAPETTVAATPGSPTGHTVDALDVYRLYFHGPAYQVVEKAWWDGDRMVGLLAKDLPSNHQPPNLPTLMAPRLIELCFQTAGLWEMGTNDRMGLPQHVDYVSSVRGAEPVGARLYALVTPGPAGSFDAEVVDAQGNRYICLRGYHTIATGNAVNHDQVKALRTILTPALVEA